MYYEIEQVAEPYNEILRNSSSPSSCQLVIFVSCLNIDALCSTKILADLFKSQLVQSQIVPVFGYSDLKQHYARLDDDIRSVVLIGCGGSINMEEFLEINTDDLLVDSKEDVRRYKRHIYIFDAHRPWNLNNIFGSDIVHCLDDGTIEESLEEERKAYYRLAELDLEENETHESEDNATDVDEEDGVSNDYDTEEDEDGDEEDFSRKRSTDSSENPNASNKKNRKQRKTLLDEYETVIEEYYSQGTCVVNSVSLQIYSLLSKIGECNLHYLWLTVLGATSLDTAYPHVYNRLYPLLQDEVRRLSPSSNTVKTPDTLSLEVQPDYYLFLLRHSSLYDSFYYSNYVNAKLSLWNENGKKRLHKMFARMGISLNIAQETWLYMDHSIKKELRIIFDRNLDRYGLQDIIRDGFVRSMGYRGAVSATEFVEALLALLEVGKTIVKYDERIEPTDKNSEMINKNFFDREEQKKWVANFWLSWDALDDDKIELLNRGIQHAKTLQKIIFNTGVAALEKKMIKNLRIYRLCVLQDGPDLNSYRNPLTLLRLGNWLVECCAESEDNALLPMVLASLNEATDTYLVAGLPPRYPRGLDMLESQKHILNNFSMAFQQISSETGARVRIDNFESSIIEIRKDDLSPFLEKLTLSGLL
ncbi:hypothetical protein HG535_0G04140 [Zygotorulaspora mrakii]|uniref:Cell division control protein 45 n=1 Tax=Zygotorulaspora mrakii TaxID=42260 RepID=A0A7H9B752_ZYGMR|nr:uncharacterized protein HG535_0G04140 [Zygotorulaspora mrakii]QLG74531.1 hypothetical protein HG535_0G04140 [Zygotorulaspora mrakii]